MSQGYVTTRAATVNLNGTSDTGTVVTGGNVGGSPVFMTYIPSVQGLFPVEAANLVWAGPATGSAALPTFRALVAADIPAIPQSGVTGLVAALASKATDSLVVHLAGIESITGVKTFTANPVFNAGGIPNASVAGLAASATTDTTNAANISSGTLPSGRLVGAYTGVTGLGILTAGSSAAPSLQLGEANSGWNFATSHKLVAVSNGQANGPQIYHDGTRYRTEFPTVSNWITWNNGTNGVVLSSPTLNSTNDGILQVVGYGTSVGGLDLGSAVRVKGASSALFVRNQTDTADANINCAAVAASGAITTGTYNLTGGSANTSLSTTGSFALFANNALATWGATDQGIFTLGSPNNDGARMFRSGLTGGPLFCRANTAQASAKADGAPQFSIGMNTSGGSANVDVRLSNFGFSSSGGVTTRTLPTAANSYVGQCLYFVQEGSNALTVTGPAGVSVTMQTGTNTFTTKTAGSFATSGLAAGDSTSATLLCTATDGATVATWRQIGGVGLWA